MYFRRCLEAVRTVRREDLSREVERTFVCSNQTVDGSQALSPDQVVTVWYRAPEILLGSVWPAWDQTRTRAWHDSTAYFTRVLLHMLWTTFHHFRTYQAEGLCLPLVELT